MDEAATRRTSASDTWEHYPLRVVETAYKHESPLVGWLPRVEVYNSYDELVLAVDCLGQENEDFIKAAVKALNDTRGVLR